MTLKDIESIIEDNYKWEGYTNKLDKPTAIKEIYELHLKEKLQLVEDFRTNLISEGLEIIADEYFEEVEGLQKELDNLK